MELRFLDSYFVQQIPLDVFQSLIWTERYNEFGDFEVSFQPFTEISEYLQNGILYYVKLVELNRYMVLEIDHSYTDPEKGDLFTLKGRSLESILDRRVMFVSKEFSGLFHTLIQTLIEINITAPPESNRTMSQVVYDVPTDPDILASTIDTQIGLGENLYDVISGLCQRKAFGFRMQYDPIDGFIHFGLYNGSDRSYGQTANPYVIFSPEYGNLINGVYVENKEEWRNTVLTAGEPGVANIRPIALTEFAPPPPGIRYSGIERRELFVDARGITRTTDDGTLTDAEYLDRLHEIGGVEGSKYQIKKSFDGQLDATNYVYGVDYFLGDILQVEDNYGNKNKSRVLEMIHSEDRSGIKIYPTFATEE